MVLICGIVLFEINERYFVSLQKLANFVKLALVRVKSYLSDNKYDSPVNKNYSLNFQ
jgi:hypothetical protein